jgi:SAM-dependent methyltransferase
VIGLDDETGWLSGYIARGPTRRLAQDLDIIHREAPKPATICEYGAAPFVLTTALHMYGYEVIGVDLAPDRFHPIRKLDLVLVGADVEASGVPFARSTFDVVVFNELFEHLRLDLIRTMREVHRIIKPEGLLVLSTPNLRSIKGVISFLVRGRSYSCANDLFSEWNKIDRIGHMGHVREYTEREIVSFLEQLGFRVTRVIYRGAFEPVTIERRLANLALTVVPRLSPHMTLILRKQSRVSKNV